ncbi:MAG: hypothetical protein HYU64_09460 [Armatimonadetes bacterium]|nr:hypothetical protein [Armatimonadota bacterium]
MEKFLLLIEQFPWTAAFGLLPLSLLFSFALSDSIAAEPARAVRTCLVAYGYFYDPSTLEKMAGNFDLIVWGDPPSHFRQCARIVNEKNPKTIQLFYRDLQAMHRYYQDWEKVAPNRQWFLNDQSGKGLLIHKTWKWCAMDLGSPGWGAHLVQSVKNELEANPDWDGVFVDDVWTYFRDEFARESDNRPALPASGYRKAFFEKTRALLARLKKGVGKHLVIVNEDFEKGDFLPESDGAMLETFVHTRLTPTFAVDPKDWKASLEALVKSGREKKLFLANSMIGEGAGEAEIEKTHRFCYATYLLGMHPRSFFSFHLDFNQVLIFDEWRLPIGKPKGPYYIKNKVYFRQFAKGLVVVNTERKKTRVTLSIPYKVWGKETTRELTLDPQSCVVLVK